MPIQSRQKDRKTSAGISHLREDGVLVSVKDAIDSMWDGPTGYRWKDLQTPASAVNPPGLASDPSVDSNDGCFLFATNDLLFFPTQMPHEWVEGTNIEPHVHWQKTTSASGTVEWTLEYKHCPIGQVEDASWTSLGAVSTTVVTDNNLAGEHMVTDLGTVDMTGRGLSHLMKFKLTRTGGTYATDAKLVSFDIHYHVNDKGSATEF